MKLTTICLLSLLLVSTAAYAQNEETIRIMTWNVLSLSAESASERIPHFARVFEAARPDIIFTLENVDLYNETGFGLALPRLPVGGWSFAPGDGPGTDPVCYFDGTKVGVTGYRTLETDLRSIVEYHFIVTATRDSFRLFVCHLKEGSAPADELQRLSEAGVILRRMDTLTRAARLRGSGDTLFIVAGTLGMHSSNEAGYVALTNANSAIPDAPFLYDPIERPGDWSDNPAFADIHTSSTRVRLFGGGDGGGMGDRLDQILFSAAMGSRYVNGSYTAYGNDGQHFNDSINRLPNLAVADSIAESLHAASDHLPVYADFIFSRGSSTVREPSAPQLSMLSISPQPASDRVTLRVLSPAAGSLDVRLVDAMGETVLRKQGVMIAEGERTIELDVRSLPAGVYGYSVGTGYGEVRGRIVVVK